jgi:hypothetical protein
MADTYQVRLGRAQAAPTLANVVAMDSIDPVSGSVVSFGANGAATLTAQSALTAGNATTAGIGAKKSEDVGAIGAGAAATFDITVAGAVAGAPVILGLPAAIDAGIIGCAYVSAGDTVTVRLANLTAAPIDPGVGVYSVRVLPAIP